LLDGFATLPFSRTHNQALGLTSKHPRKEILMNTNEVTLVGRIAQPEEKQIGHSTLVTAGLAFVDGKETGWISLTAWNELGKSLMSLPKGTMVQVTGRLSVNNYTNREGKKTSKLFIKIHSIQKCQVSYTLIA
jgi:single-stranded DNA-binding protein